MSNRIPNSLKLPNVPTHPINRRYTNRNLTIRKYDDNLKKIDEFINTLDRFSILIFENDLILYGIDNKNRRIIYDNTKSLILILMRLKNIFLQKKTNIRINSYINLLTYITHKESILNSSHETINELIKSNWKSNISQINDLIIVYSRAISEFL